MIDGNGWKKKLYIRNNVPDNSVPETFLEEMRKNVHIRIYSFSELLSKSCLVAFHFNWCFIFITFYVIIKQELVSKLLEDTLVVEVTVSFYMLLILISIFRREQTPKTMTFVTLIYVPFIYGISPIVKTLTGTISNDTIYAVSTITFGIHLFTHHYERDSKTQNEDESTVHNTNLYEDIHLLSSRDAFSLNSALIATICLVSRLSKTYEVFLVISVSVTTFVISPFIRRNYFQELSLRCKLMLLHLMIVFVGILSFFDTLIITCVVISHAVVLLISPCLFLLLQQHKNVITGPWDQAIPIIKTEEDDIYQIKNCRINQ
ncbi:hypothetical protein SNEBB_006273 [Seison nebaliae]|nr:hypothetical protein SNEBB_006273 [Seison nebaliae]